MVLYMEHVDEHYRKNGRPTSAVSCIKTAMRYLVAKTEHHDRERTIFIGPRYGRDAYRNAIQRGVWQLASGV
ncbi:MAG: hypothetical protein WD069_20755 [Planctomycetales bacterium]